MQERSAENLAAVRFGNRALECKLDLSQRVPSYIRFAEMPDPLVCANVGVLSDTRTRSFRLEQIMIKSF